MATSLSKTSIASTVEREIGPRIAGKSLFENVNFRIVGVKQIKNAFFVASEPVGPRNETMKTVIMLLNPYNLEAQSYIVEVSGYNLSVVKSLTQKELEAGIDASFEKTGEFKGKGVYDLVDHVARDKSRAWPVMDAK